MENNIREKQLKKTALDSKSPSLNERAVALYREKDKQVKTSARRDKRQYVERLATEAEAEPMDMKTVYQITGKLHGDRGQNQDLTVKGYEDSLPDHKETTWRQRTEPRPYC